MKIKVTAAMIVVTVLLGILCLTSYLLSDRIAPEITVPVDTVVYEEGDDDSVLLEGVSAVDDRDGDISSNVRIYDVAVMAEGENAMVTYAVYDSSYNLAKAYKVVDYVPKQDRRISDGQADTTDEMEEIDENEASDEQTVDASAKQTDAADEKADASDKQTADDESDTSDKQTADDKTGTSDKQTASGKTSTSDKQTSGKKTEVSTQAGDSTDGYEDLPLVSTGAPVLRLRTHEIHVTVGGSFYSMDYVDTAVDDKDSKNALFERMYMSGYYDTDKPGEYELTYYCLDSDENVSNMAKLKMIVTQAGE